MSTGTLFLTRQALQRKESQKQPLFAAFVDLKKASDSVQHPPLWALLQRKGIHGKMLAGIQSLYDGGDMSMKISGSSDASGTARVGVRQGCPLSPTLFGIFFDSLDAQLQAESAAAGVEFRGARVPGLFYADDVALLSPSAQGLQQLLDTMQSFCVTNGLTISIPKTEVVVFGGGHQQCQWHVGGYRLMGSIIQYLVSRPPADDVHENDLQESSVPPAALDKPQLSMGHQAPAAAPVMLSSTSTADTLVSHQQDGDHAQLLALALERLSVPKPRPRVPSGSPEGSPHLHCHSATDVTASRIEQHMRQTEQQRSVAQSLPVPRHDAATSEVCCPDKAHLPAGWTCA